MQRFNVIIFDKIPESQVHDISAPKFRLLEASRVWHRTWGFELRHVLLRHLPLLPRYRPSPEIDTCIRHADIYTWMLTLTLMIMKEATHCVRLCWMPGFRDWIFPMKVCLLEQVTAIPSISFRNLQMLSSDHVKKGGEQEIMSLEGYPS